MRTKPVAPIGAKNPTPSRCQWQRTTGPGGTVAFNPTTRQVELTGNFAVGLGAIAKRYGVTLQSLFRVIMGQYVDEQEKKARQ